VLLNSDAATLDFDQAGTMSASATYAGGQLSGITVNGKDITAEITSGTLGALLELRDKTLLARQAELDSLATTLAETLNAISNQGSALPAPSSLAGTQAVSASDAFSATGTARIAVVSSDGTVADVLDLDLSNYATVSDLVSAIDAMASVDAALDADGHLVLTATDSSTGVALSEMDSAVGAGGEGWSSYFGLNDLLVVDDNGRLSVRDDILADSGLLPLASLSTEAGIAAGDIGLSSGGTTITAKLSEAMSISHQFAAAGAAGATQATFSDYFADLVGVTATLSDKAADTANAKEQIVSSLESTFSSASGVNVDEELAELTALETLYNASATVMQVVQQMYDTLMDII
jgi:flagellar hook-associated protein 1 FlgK